MRAEKKYLISEVEGHLKKSDYVILANFTKVTVSDTAELRKRLDAEKAEFHVVKNSSFRVAAKAFGLPEVDNVLSGPTAIIVGGKTRPASRRSSRSSSTKNRSSRSRSVFWRRRFSPPKNSPSSRTCPPSSPSAPSSSASSPATRPPSCASSMPRSKKSNPPPNPFLRLAA